MRVPTRVIVSSESFPRDPFRTWASVTDRPYVLGDFVWAGIDYLSESGIGRYYTPNEKIYPHAEPQQFSYHGAYCDDIDITGFRKPVSYARKIVWDRGEKLYTSITEPTPSGKKMRVGPGASFQVAQAGHGPATKGNRWKFKFPRATTWSGSTSTTR